MIYIIVGLLCSFTVCGLVLRYVNGKFSNCVRGDNLIFSLANGCLISAVLIGFRLFIGPDADYTTCSKNYVLEEINENQYYLTNADTNTVSIFIKNDKTTGTKLTLPWIKITLPWEKITFQEDNVKFHTTTGEANAQIKLKKIQEPSSMEIFWFMKGCKLGQKKEIYESAIISIPEGTESAKELEAFKEERKNFCDECGSKVEAASKFCSQCGKQL